MRAYLQEPCRIDQHHKRRRKVLDILLQLGATRVQGADACAALKDLHDEHPVICQEAAGRTLSDIALGSAREDGSTNDACHAEQEGVVFLERRGVVGT